ncbi:MAG: hypothetical protein ACXW30_06680 [Micavibrio sp.]
MSKEPSAQGIAAMRTREADKLRLMLCGTFNSLEKQGVLEQHVNAEGLQWWAQQKPRYERELKLGA